MTLRQIFRINVKYYRKQFKLSQEKLAEKLQIKDVRQTDRLLTIYLPEEISSKIKGDKLFLEAYNINPKFQLKYENRKISISLNIMNLKKHFIYDVVALLQKIVFDLEV